jgi:hypothetical protein
MQQLDSRLAYVVMHRFLEKLWEAGNVELGGLLGGMCLSLDRERSMDPAMISDWRSVTDRKNSFTEREALDAARVFLTCYYNRGPLPEITAVLEHMRDSGNQDADSQGSVALWHTCWNEVAQNAQVRNPFKTAYSYARNAQGEPGRFQRNVEGFLEFRPD